MEGKTIRGKYEIIELISENPVAMVYRAKHLALNHTIAVKVLNRDLIRKDKSFSNRFNGIAKSLQNLDQQNLVNILDAFEEKKDYFIIMDYVNGHSIKSLIAEFGPLSVDNIAAVLTEAGAAVDYVHSKELVHRDVCSRNVMVREKDFHVMLMDLGLARTTKTPFVGVEGVQIGSPEYMSPEQVDGNTGTLSSDIYALGILAYEMLTGNVPFEEKSPLKTLLAHKNQTPPPIKEKRTDISDETKKAVLKALEKNPEDRFEAASEFARAFLKKRNFLFFKSPTKFKTIQPKVKKTRKKVSASSIAVTAISILAIILFSINLLKPPPPEKISSLMVDLRSQGVVAEDYEIVFEPKTIEINGEKNRIRVLAGSIETIPFDVADLVVGETTEINLKNIDPTHLTLMPDSIKVMLRKIGDPPINWDENETIPDEIASEVVTDDGLIQKQLAGIRINTLNENSKFNYWLKTNVTKITLKGPKDKIAEIDPGSLGINIDVAAFSKDETDYSYERNHKITLTIPQLPDGIELISMVPNAVDLTVKWEPEIEPEEVLIADVPVNKPAVKKPAPKKSTVKKNIRVIDDVSVVLTGTDDNYEYSLDPPSVGVKIRGPKSVIYTDEYTFKYGKRRMRLNVSKFPEGKSNIIATHITISPSLPYDVNFLFMEPRNIKLIKTLKKDSQLVANVNPKTSPDTTPASKPEPDEILTAEVLNGLYINMSGRENEYLYRLLPRKIDIEILSTKFNHGKIDKKTVKPIIDVSQYGPGTYNITDILYFDITGGCSLSKIITDKIELIISEKPILAY